LLNLNYLIFEKIYFKRYWPKAIEAPEKHLLILLPSWCLNKNESYIF